MPADNLCKFIERLLSVLVVVCACALVFQCVYAYIYVCVCVFESGATRTLYYERSRKQKGSHVPSEPPKLYYEVTQKTKNL